MWLLVPCSRRPPPRVFRPGLSLPSTLISVVDPTLSPVPALCYLHPYPRGHPRTRISSRPCSRAVPSTPCLVPCSPFGTTSTGRRRVVRENLLATCRCHLHTADIMPRAEWQSLVFYSACFPTVCGRYLSFLPPPLPSPMSFPFPSPFPSCFRPQVSTSVPVSVPSTSLFPSLFPSCVCSLAFTPVFVPVPSSSPSPSQILSPFLPPPPFAPSRPLDPVTPPPQCLCTDYTGPRKRRCCVCVCVYLLNCT